MFRPIPYDSRRVDHGLRLALQAHNAVWICECGTEEQKDALTDEEGRSICPKA